MDIATNLSSGTTASSFADDTRIQHGIDQQLDCEVLQQDLNTVYSWAEQTGMKFNAGKFELLRFWSNRDSAPDYQYLGPDKEPIREKGSLKDLGVRISSDLTFTDQIDLAVASGSRMAGWALRTFRGRGRCLMLTILRSLIQPHLDYCSQLWSPRDQWSIKRLEAVQKNFLSQIRDRELSSKNYWERLSLLRV